MLIENKPSCVWFSALLPNLKNGVSFQIYMNHINFEDELNFFELHFTAMLVWGFRFQNVLDVDDFKVKRFVTDIAEANLCCIIICDTYHKKFLAFYTNWTKITKLNQIKTV